MDENLVENKKTIVDKLNASPNELEAEFSETDMLIKQLSSLYNKQVSIEESLIEQVTLLNHIDPQLQLNLIELYHKRKPSSKTPVKYVTQKL